MLRAQEQVCACAATDEACLNQNRCTDSAPEGERLNDQLLEPDLLSGYLKGSQEHLKVLLFVGFGILCQRGEKKKPESRVRPASSLVTAFPLQIPVTVIEIMSFRTPGSPGRSFQDPANFTEQVLYVDID